MLVVLFDVIYCLIVTSKHTHIYMRTEALKSNMFIVPQVAITKKWKPMPGERRKHKQVVDVELTM